MTLKNSLSENNNENQPQTKKPLNSGLSIWQLTLKTIKRHIWLPILALLGFVLALPVASTLAINNFSDWDFGGDTQRQLEYFTDWGADLSVVWQMLSACIIVVGALLSVLVMFRYLHVRTQVDFYHSLPVRREQFFVSNVMAAFLVFLAPYLLATLLNVLVLAISGWVNYVNMGLYMQFVLFNIVVYVLFLGCGCLAMQLSGTMPSALKILVMTFGLAPLLAGMYEMLGSVFFESWVSMFSSASVLLLKASVIERYFLLSAMARGEVWYDVPLPQIICWQDWLAAVGLAAVMLGLSLLLYRRRSSEAAGSTLAFGWQKPFYKYPLVVCSGLMLGVFFYLMGENSIIWLYFGAVLGTMFMALVLEVFIKSDFKAVKKGWRSAVLTSVAVCLLLSVYAFDLVGFDQRRPSSEKVETVYVYSFNLMNAGGDYYYYDNGDEIFFDKYWSMNHINSMGGSFMSFSEPENVEAVLALSEKAQNALGEYGYDDSYIHVNMSVYYKLKNGSMQARNYWGKVDIKSYQQAIETLVLSEEWRQQMVINKIKPEQTVVCGLDSYQLGWESYIHLEDLRLGDEWQKEFLQTLRNDYANVSLEDFLYSSPIGNLEMGEYKERKYVPEGDYYNYSGMRRYDIRIFPCMTDTINMLNQVTDNALNPNIDLSQVVELREYHRLDKEEYEKMISEMSESYIDGAILENSSYEQDKLLNTYKPETDAAKIEQILQNSVTSRSYWQSPMFNDNMVDIYYELVYRQTASQGDYEVNGGDLVETISNTNLYPQPSRELFERLIKN